MYLFIYFSHLDRNPSIMMNNIINSCWKWKLWFYHIESLLLLCTISNMREAASHELMKNTISQEMDIDKWFCREYSVCVCVKQAFPAEMFCCVPPLGASTHTHTHTHACMKHTEHSCIYRFSLSNLWWFVPVYLGLKVTSQWPLVKQVGGEKPMVLLFYLLSFNFSLTWQAHLKHAMQSLALLWRSAELF